MRRVELGRASVSWSGFSALGAEVELGRASVPWHGFSALRYDFVSRFFAPGAGVIEDPVTGSAHCCLTPFWAQRPEKQRMLAFQASQRRGVVRVELHGERVYLEGQAVTVSRIELDAAAQPG